MRELGSIHLRHQKGFLVHHPRIQVYEFRTRANELNPTKFEWAQISESTAGTAPHNGAELGAYMHAGIARTRRSQARLWAFIHASHLPWNRTRA